MNHCGSFSKDRIVVEEKEIKENTVDTSFLEAQSEFIQFSSDSEKMETDEYFLILENLRNENEPLFKKVIALNKIFMEKISYFNNNDPQNEIAFFEKIIEILEKELNLNITYLHWSLNKSMKIAILEIKNIELIHFFIVKLKLRIRSEFFQEIICEYIRSFGEEDFLDSEEIKIFSYVTILHMLINYGKADINQQEKSSQCTPLHLAVFYKQYQFIIILLKLGAKTEIKNKNNQTPLELAMENIQNQFDEAIYREIVGLLTAFDAKYNF